MRRSACACAGSRSPCCPVPHRPIACSADTSHSPSSSPLPFFDDTTRLDLCVTGSAPLAVPVCRRGARGLSDSGVFPLSLARVRSAESGRGVFHHNWFFTVDLSSPHLLGGAPTSRTISSSWRASKMVCGASPSTSSRTWSQMQSSALASDGGGAQAQKGGKLCTY